MDKLTDILHSSDCISPKLIADYASRMLSASDMHRIEKHALSCPMCADMLDGAMAMNNASVLSAVNEIIHSKIDQRLQKGRVLNFRKAFMYAAAAMVALVFVSTVVMQQLFMEEPSDMAQNIEKHEATNRPISEADELLVRENESIDSVITEPTILPAFEIVDSEKELVKIEAKNVAVELAIAEDSEILSEDFDLDTDVEMEEMEVVNNIVTDSLAVNSASLADARGITATDSQLVNNAAEELENSDDIVVAAAGVSQEKKQTGLFGRKAKRSKGKVAEFQRKMDNNEVITESINDESNELIDSDTIVLSQAELLSKATTAYNQKQYQSAINSLNQISSKRLITNKTRWMSAKSQYELNNFTEAEKLLIKLSKTKSVYKDSATIYLRKISSLQNRRSINE